jgi:hypothetical protein
MSRFLPFAPLAFPFLNKGSCLAAGINGFVLVYLLQAARLFPATRSSRAFHFAPNTEEEVRSQKGKSKSGTTEDTEKHRGKIPQSGTKAVLCHRFARMNTDKKQNTNRSQHDWLKFDRIELNCVRRGCSGKPEARRETQKTHPSENPAGRGKPAGWGTSRFRYARMQAGNGGPHLPLFQRIHAWLQE